MKNIFVLAVIFIISSSFGRLIIDEFSVIKVIGDIKHSKSNKALFTGDKVFSNEKLKFAQNTSKAALINKDKGRFMLQHTESGTVSAGLMPALNNVSSRAGALLNAIDLKKHFEDKYLILNGYEIEISSKSFPMDEKNFFFLRFDYKGEEISKKISFKENKLLLNPDEILKIDGKAISLKEGTKMSLNYRNSSDNTSTQISVFEPVFVNEKILKDECKLIAFELGSETNSESKKEHILAYLTENYGKAHQESLYNWLKQNLGI
jgi:hypothetical protein